MCPSIRVFACRFNTALLHRVTVVKCADGYPGVGLGYAPPLRWPARSPDFSHPKFFLWNVIKPRPAPVRLLPDRKCGVEFNNLQPKEMRSPGTLQQILNKFPFHTDLSCASFGANLETKYTERSENSILVCFLHTRIVSHSGSVQGVNTEV